MSVLDVADAHLEAISVPYKSDKQRKWMHANKPRIAARWDEKYGGKVSRKKPKHSPPRRPTRGAGRPT